MKDRVPLYPGRVKLTPVSGQENTYDMVRADEPTQEGDPLSKSTFLKDATAALFGLGNDAVPDDVLTTIKAILVTMETNAVRIAIGSYSGTGKSGESYPNSITFDFEPKFVYVMPSSHGQDGKRLFLIRGCTKSASGTSSSTENTIEWSGNTVSWYGGVGQNVYIESQLNISGTTYRYFAIG